MFVSSLALGLLRFMVSEQPLLSYTPYASSGLEEWDSSTSIAVEFLTLAPFFKIQKS